MSTHDFSDRLPCSRTGRAVTGRAAHAVRRVRQGSVCASFVFVLATCAFGAGARAEEPSKEACVDAHSQGQDAKEQGKVTLARKLFVSCAQAGCPELVQNDCARFADELARSQPSLSFAARDEAGHDLPDTSIYVDDVLVATHLSDGRAHDVDPGRHVVRFSHGASEQITTVVAGSGDRGRMIMATFKPVERVMLTGRATPPEKAPPEDPPLPAGARALLGAGAALALGGAVVGATGLARLPERCSLSRHECAAPPGDPVFDDASSAVRLSNLGWSIGAVGLGALAASLAWHLKVRRSERRAPLITPAIGVRGAGFALSGRL